MAAIRASSLVLIALATLLHVVAADPEPLLDYVLKGDPKGKNFSKNFKFKGLRNSTHGITPPPGQFHIDFVSQLTFPALNSQGLSVAIGTLGPNASIPIHSHQRSAELVYVLKGAMEVAFVDGAGNLFANVLYQGDLMIIPRGLAHFIFNKSKGISTAFTIMNSANPGFSVLEPAVLALRALSTMH